MQLKSQLLTGVIAGLWQQPQREDAAANTSGGKAKAPGFCEKDWDDAFEGNGSELYFNFANGTKLTFDMDKVPAPTRRLLSFHGASQKIGDSFAGVKGNFGQGIEKAEKVIAQLYVGEWEGEREGGGPRLAELSAAIARIKDVPLEKAAKAVEKASKEQRDTWRGNAQVKSAVADIRAEKAAKQYAESQKAGQQQEIQVEIE